MKVNPSLVGPCGLYCGVCAIYIADRDNNLKLKEKLVNLYKGGIPGKGTPQGGIISPTLANMALDGIQNLLSTRFRKQDKVHMVRYADDFIITGKTDTLLSDQIKPLIVQFLNDIGCLVRRTANLNFS